VSSVSGGSIAAGILAVAWDRLDFDEGTGRSRSLRTAFVEPLLSFTQRFVDVPCAAIGLANPLSSASGELTKAYDRHLFKGKTLQSLPTGPGKPRFVFCSSNLSTGSLFRFSRPYMADYRLGRSFDPDVPLAIAVAASSAFPPVLSPLRLDLSRYEFVRGHGEVDPGTALLRRAVLTDGGVYDNHGLEPVIKRCRTVLVSDGGAPWRTSGASMWNWYSQLKRVLDTVDNQVRSLRRSDLIDRFRASRACSSDPSPKGSLRDVATLSGAYWGLATDPAHFMAVSPLGFPYDRRLALGSIGTGLHFLGEADTADLINWGYVMSDLALRSYLDPTLPSPVKLPLQAGQVKPTIAARLVHRLFELAA
jgi:NTE family protein